MISERHPGRPIDIVARRSSAEIATFMPEIRDAIGETFAHNSLSPRARLALAAALRKRRYGTAYLIQSSFKSALVPFLAGIPERIGWSDEGRLALLTKPRFGLRRLPRMVDRVCRLGLADGHDRDIRWPEPRLEIPPALSAQFDALVRKARATGPVIALAPGSAHGYKNWPIANFAAIAKRCAELGWTVWLVGARRDEALAHDICKRAPAHDCFSESLTQLALTIAAADVFIGNDSGPLHLAAAFGKPCVGIFGHTDIDSKVPINAGVKAVTPDRAVAQMSRADVHWPSIERVSRCLDEVLASRPDRSYAEVALSPAAPPVKAENLL